MNFDFLEPVSKLKKLYEYCSEADEFAISKPNVSITSARKAMEYIVKMIYGAIVGMDAGLTVFEMCTDPRFGDYVKDETLISTIHFIRKMGNIAVHEGELTKNDAVKVLENLHFLVGEYCILLGLTEDYPEFEEPGATPPPAAAASSAVK